MFHESLAAMSIRPADLIAQGLPRSTAYDWCKGSSTPDHAAFVLALLQSARPAGEQDAAAKKRGGGVGHKIKVG